jgi:hypothetical protein
LTPRTPGEQRILEAELSAKKAAYKIAFDAAMKKFGVKYPAELEDGQKKLFFDYIAALQKVQAEGVLDPSDPTARGDADSERRARNAEAQRNYRKRQTGEGDAEGQASGREDPSEPMIGGEKVKLTGLTKNSQVDPAF